MRKATAIVEYSVLLFLVIAAGYGLQSLVKRSIQQHIKQQTDDHLSRPTRFLWQGALTFRNQENTFDRFETSAKGRGGAEIEVSSTADNSYTTLAPPTPPGVPVAGLHVQDAASPPPGQQNPKEGNDDNQPNRERH